mmetsp:Transcript_5168/g.16432  ORF Transcript_5168/g.16432 Transcript_5168/m.16432 type:complete len:357 (-) Transcript_5168:1187-2257(-)|eukprot:scaffold132354_cov32-Tisochrysis_lutea.AAC.1
MASTYSIESEPADSSSESDSSSEAAAYLRIAAAAAARRGARATPAIGSTTPRASSSLASESEITAAFFLAGALLVAAALGAAAFGAAAARLVPADAADDFFGTGAFLAGAAAGGAAISSSDSRSKTGRVVCSATEGGRAGALGAAGALHARLALGFGSGESPGIDSSLSSPSEPSSTYLRAAAAAARLGAARAAAGATAMSMSEPSLSAESSESTIVSVFLGAARFVAAALLEGALAGPLAAADGFEAWVAALSSAVIIADQLVPCAEAAVLRASLSINDSSSSGFSSGTFMAAALDPDAAVVTADDALGIARSFRSCTGSGAGGGNASAKPSSAGVGAFGALRFCAGFFRLGTSS